jgi:hypothetical protein
MKPTNTYSRPVFGWGLIVMFHIGTLSAAPDTPAPRPSPPTNLRIVVPQGQTAASEESRTASAPSQLVTPSTQARTTVVSTSSAIVTNATSPALQIPILVVSYFPTNGDNIDIRVTGDVGDTLAAIQSKTRRLTQEIITTLQEGSRYRAYSDASSKPSLVYYPVGSIEQFEPLPTKSGVSGNAPMTDYRSIMDRINIRDWVEVKGVKEIWIWGYHGGKIGLWESNMSSPFGDVSNSDCDTNDLPVLNRSYTVYHYNYQRGLSEAVEDHMHQIEALLNFVDGRHLTPQEEWTNLLFWGKFVGSDHTHHIVHPGCGWAHYPPNATQDYDWANRVYVETDMDDWRPDGSGQKAKINCERWGCNSLGWFTFWMQHLPGPGNELQFQGKKLNNWWSFVGDWDRAREQKLKLLTE